MRGVLKWFAGGLAVGVAFSLLTNPIGAIFLLLFLIIATVLIGSLIVYVLATTPVLLGAVMLVLGTIWLVRRRRTERLL